MGMQQKCALRSIPLPDLCLYDAREKPTAASPPARNSRCACLPTAMLREPRAPPHFAAGYSANCKARMCAGMAIGSRGPRAITALSQGFSAISAATAAATSASNWTRRKLGTCLFLSHCVVADSCLYLPRLKDSQVLAAAVQDGLGLLLWQSESFAFADSFDEAAGRYRGLRCGQQVVGSVDSLGGVLVKADVAVRQQAADTALRPGPSTGGETAERPGGEPVAPGDGPTPGKPVARTPNRFHGTVVVDPARVGRDAGRIADEVISHLVGLVGSEVTVTIEIEARIPSGAPDNVVRTVTENSRTLKFTSQGFEED